MTQHLKWNSNTLYDDTSLTNFVLLAETDINGRVHVIEDSGDPELSIYRGTRMPQRVYEARVLCKAGGSYSTVTALIAAWEGWHSKRLGQKVLERKTATSTTLQLDAVAEAPQWENEGPLSIEVVQRYLAAVPYWRASSESNNSASFNGSTPVNLAVNNTGDVPTWLRFVISGAVTTPKIAYSTEWELEFALTMSTGDQLEIVCQTPAEAWYTPNGGSATVAYGYRTAASMFRKAKAPVGNNNLTLTATSGTASCTAYWYNRVEALE